HVIDARWIMAYSAGLGETDARYYDTAAPGGPLAHPLFPVCYEWPVSQPIRDLPAIVPHKARLVHAQHDVLIHRMPRADETIRTTARIVAALQRPPGAFVVYRFDAHSMSGEALTTTYFGVIYRGVELDGPSHTTEKLEEPPPTPPNLELLGRIQVGATAAHVYTECARIWNPIHTDIAYAKAAGLPGLILHGTATLALSVSRLLRDFPGKVRRVRCRFAGMVLMPSTLTVHGARSPEAIGFETRNAQGEAVITRGQLLLE
ncbi:MAG TPA: MaoC/PaaZ C-terminal domain-containing protein, partial [Burkholderiales bacterium]